LFYWALLNRLKKEVENCQDPAYNKIMTNEGFLGPIRLSAQDILTHDLNHLKGAKVFLFDDEQARYFYDEYQSLPQNYKLSFRLPFDNLFVQLTKPIRVFLGKDKHEDYLAGLHVYEVEYIYHPELYDPQLASEFREWYSKVNPRHYEVHYYYTDMKFNCLEFNSEALPLFKFQNFDCREACDLPNRTLQRLYNINAVKLKMKSGEISKEDLPYELPLIEGECFGFSTQGRNPETKICPHADNYEKLKNLTVNIVNFLNARNIVYIQHYRPPRYAKDGSVKRRELPPYYTLEVKRETVEYLDQSQKEGGKHSYRYDVRGHFRHFRDGSCIWVRPHQRGLRNILYKPKIWHFPGDLNESVIKAELYR